ncbi:hypothetical protein QS257_14720 [Terrilactibacillus sp. S3-3]|nr:hypothetical protein QS257_14720 [Terrilactibacillus sp. S3-3]
MLFTPFMILGAVFGLEELMKIADLRRTGKTKVIVEIWSRIVLSICLLLSVLLCAILSYQEDTQTKIAYKQYSVNQFYQTGGATVTVNKQNSIEQTFKAQFAFNRILIGIQKKKEWKWNLQIFNF